MFSFPPRATFALLLLISLTGTFIASIWHVAPLVHTLPPSFDLYSTEYVAADIRAPTAVGWKLRMIARIIVSSPLGDYLARALLVKNGVPQLVDFAEEISNDLENDGPNGKEFIVGEPPLIRLSSADYAWHENAAKAEIEQAAKRLEAHSVQNNETCDSNTKKKYNSIYDYHRAYAENITNPSKVIAKLLAFIGKTDSRLRCVESQDVDGATWAAEASTERWKNGEQLGIWDGVPVMVKPEFMVEGMPYTSGKQFRDDGSDLAPYDDIIISRIKDAGGIVVAYTTMHELGVQPTGYNPIHGGPHNPHALDRFSGGSSSGSAVAVAAGMVPVALGQDGGGSIRIPAAWSGTVGLAAGFARIPFRKGRETVFAVAKAGVLTATVNDSLEALLLIGQDVSEEEGAKHHALHVSYGGGGLPPPHSRSRWFGTSLNRPSKVGVLWDWVGHRPPKEYAGTTGKDDAVYQSFIDTIKMLESESSKLFGRTVEVVNVTIPHLHTQALVHGILITSMFSFVQLRELYRGKNKNRRESPKLDDDLQPATEVQIKLGSQISALELMACYRIRNWALAQWRTVLEEVDVILTPTTPMTALVRPSGSDEAGLSDTGLFVQMMRYIWPGNLVGLPGLAVPIGTDSDGLPLSVQVLCGHWHEADCLSIGGVIENLTSTLKPRPPDELFVDLLGDD